MTPDPVFRRRDLPHWDMPGATFFIISCLEGSIPAQGLLDLINYRKQLAARPRPDGRTAEEWEAHLWKLGFARLDEMLDAAEGSHWLKDPAAAKIVNDGLRFFAGQRYDLFAYVVMPSHFHWLFRPRDEWVATLPRTGRFRSPRERVMYSVRRYTANQCNRLLGRRGEFWQHESYDHWARDLDELERIIHYIENNPVRAGLCRRPEDWPWSSAAVRVRLGLPFGAPIPKVG